MIFRLTYLSHVSAVRIGTRRRRPKTPNFCLVSGSGIVDSRFRHETGFTGRTDEPVNLSRRLVERRMDLLVRTAEHVDVSIRATKPPARKAS